MSIVHIEQVHYIRHTCLHRTSAQSFKCSLGGNCKHKLISAGASDCFFYFNFFSEKQISLACLKCFEINQVLPGNNRHRSEFVFWKGFHNLHNLIFVSCSVHFGADVPGVFVAPHRAHLIFGHYSRANFILQHKRLYWLQGFILWRK